MIGLEKVTPDNWRIGLKGTVIQKLYVSDNMKLLAKGKIIRIVESN